MAAKSASLSVNIIADAAKAKAGLKEAETAFGKFRREVGNAEGAMGKFRTISGSAFDYVKQNAVGFATAAAAAIGTFAVKSVTAFQDLALSAGKFADATGLSSEEASRFIEVAGDIGIEAGAVEKSIGFMNKTLGNSPELFKSLGVEIAYAANGSRDANGTFINVVDRLNQIKDPAERAAVATKLLGRGWMEMAEMIGMGADQLSASLASVSEEKVIDQAELQRARDFRAATDELKDSWEEFSLKIGESLVPALTDAFNWVNKLIDAIDNLPGGFDAFASGGLSNLSKLNEAFNNLITDGFFGLDAQVQISNDAFDGMRVGLEDVSDKMRDVSLDSQELTDWLSQQAEEVDIARGKWDEFRNGLSIELESLQLQQDIDDFEAKWGGATEEMKRKSREYQEDLLRIQIQLGNAALAIVGLATTAQNNRIRLLIDTGRLYEAKSLIDAIEAGMNRLAGSVTPDRVERILNSAASRIPAGITPGTTAPAPKASAPSSKSASPPAAFDPGLIKSKLKNIKGIATGGTITAGGMALVGEQGPELVTLPRAASVIPSIPSRKLMGGGMTVNISVQAGLVSSPDQVGQQIIDAIRRAERRSGQVFASNT